MDIAALLQPWIDVVLGQVPDLQLFDAHTHIGSGDPDGMAQTPEELLEILRVADAQGCFVFPFHQPDGYPAANDFVLRAAKESDGLLIPFCRVDPNADAVTEARRALAAGARGIKLHPRAEQFPLDHPQVRMLFELADERSLPILIHAGRGIPALGVHAVRLAGEFPNARVILAHAGITDLSWIWRAAADLPNLLFDTAWWMPADLQALFSFVPPGQIVFASDAPYGHTLASGALQMRVALQAGLSAEQIDLIGSGQAQRLADRRPLLPGGPAAGERDRAGHVLLDRLAEFLLLAAIMTIRGGDGEEMLALARLACEVPQEIDDAPVFEAIRRLLGIYDEITRTEPDNRRRMIFLMMAITVARTPDVPIPA